MQREQSLSFDVRGLVLTANATRLQKQVAWFFATKASLSSFPGAAENGGDSNHEVENSDAVANSLLSIFNKGGLAKYLYGLYGALKGNGSGCAEIDGYNRTMPGGRWQTK
jgi:hypothetical protein